MDITIPYPLFEDNQDRGKKANTERALFIPRDYSKAITLWEQTNKLFLEHFPASGESRVVKSEDSRFAGKQALERIRTLQQKSTTQWEDTERSVFSRSIDELRDCRNSAPYGYCQFLHTVDFISAKLDDLVAQYPDFWNRLPLGYWSDGAAIYDHAIELVDFISSLEPLLDQSVEEIYKSAGNSVARKSITIKVGDNSVRTDVFWKDVIIEGILNEVNRWFEEAGIPIDTWDMSSKEARKTIREIKKNNVSMDGENASAYITGNLINILDWPGATPGNPNSDSAEFIMRFLNICGLDKDNRIVKLDKLYQESPKDCNGRPLNKSAYFGERREISELIRRLNIAYKSMS